VDCLPGRVEDVPGRAEDMKPLLSDAFQYSASRDLPTLAVDVNDGHRNPTIDPAGLPDFRPVAAGLPRRYQLGSAE
jgi:hypothetical protein